MLDQKLILAVVCFSIILTGSIVGQQTNQASQNNLRQQNSQNSQIDPGLIPPGRESEAARVAARTPVTPVTPVNPVAPEWTKAMTPEHHQALGQLLDYWEQSSEKVKQYLCDFTRYDYDTKFCNWRNPADNRLAAASIMTGEIRFSAPDHASYETLLVYDFDGPPEQAGQDAKYKKRDESTNREKWICDGKAIFEHDFENKKLYETQIPPEMQGKGLVNSPIPFLFGASKEDVLNRFWVHIVTPDGVEDEYYLEAVPKKIDDARNYKKILLVISRKDFLPVMLEMYAPNYDPKQNNFTSRVFEFKNRRANAAINKVQNFFGKFVRPSTPRGWERVARKPLQSANPQLDRAALEQPGANQIK